MRVARLVSQQRQRPREPTPDAKIPLGFIDAQQRRQGSGVTDQAQGLDRRRANDRVRIFQPVACDGTDHLWIADLAQSLQGVLPHDRVGIADSHCQGNEHFLVTIECHQLSRIGCRRRTNRCTLGLEQPEHSVQVDQRIPHDCQRGQCIGHHGIVWVVEGQRQIRRVPFVPGEGDGQRRNSPLVGITPLERTDQIVKPTADQIPDLVFPLTRGESPPLFIGVFPALELLIQSAEELDLLLDRGRTAPRRQQRETAQQQSNQASHLFLPLNGRTRQCASPGSESP